VLATISDKRIPVYENDGMTVAYYDVDLLSAVDYYPFGMQMPGRVFNGGGYRFVHNGIEKDNEVSGVGNHYSAQFGHLDPRLGRRWNQDPKPNPSFSNYAVFANSPVWVSDVALDTLRALTTFRLRSMAREQGVGGVGINFNRKVGKMFERVGLQSQNLNENKTKRPILQVND